MKPLFPIAHPRTEAQNVLTGATMAILGGIILALPAVAIVVAFIVMARG